MVKWSKATVERITGKPVPKQAWPSAIPKPLPTGVQHIKNSLTMLGIEFVAEYVFHDKRKFRFDFALINEKIAIEYEGLNSEKSRHTTIGGYTADAEKYNLAVVNGWRLLRYTAKNYKDMTKDLKQLLQ